MGSRLELQTLLEGILGNQHVYFQPPTSLTMQYPAIVYSCKDIKNSFADNKVYSQAHYWQIMVIDKNPDSNIVTKVSQLPSCRFDRQYTVDNLNHTNFILHF